MVVTKKRVMFLTLGVVLIVLFACMTILGVVPHAAQAAETPTWGSELVVAHMTDSHYYPIRYLYKGTNRDRMVSQMLDRDINSEASFMEALNMVRKIKPQYLFITGDNSNDGERVSLIDMANLLRKLQNEMRATIPNFQVFAVFGNHDLYNPAPSDRRNGASIPNVTRKDVSVIYASLGYPDITNEQAEAYYSAEEIAGENGAPTGFVNSTTATNLEMSWAFDTAKADYAPGELTFIAKTPYNTSVVGLDIPKSNVVEGHVLGGRLYDNIKTFLNENKTDSEYFMGLAHHSFVEHMAFQEQYLTGFVVDDWKNQADFLADYGMRYVYTGHVHSNDISHRVSFNNNQITDIQTASAIEDGANVRKTTFVNGTVGNKKVQNFYVQDNFIKRIDMSKLFDGGYLTTELLTSRGMDKFFQGRTLIDFQGFAEKMFVEGTIKHNIKGLLKPSIITQLKNSLEGVVGNILGGIIKPQMVNEAIDILISEIETKVLKDYTYKGSDPVLKNSKLFAFANDLIDRAFELEVSEGMNILDFIVTVFLGYKTGIDVESYDLVPENIKKATENIRSGAFVKTLLDFLLDEDQGVMFLLRGAFTTPLDFSSSASFKTLVEMLLPGLVSTPKNKITYDASKLVLGKVASDFINSPMGKNLIKIDIDLKGENIIEFADDIIEKYLTPSLYSGFGELVARVLTGFLVDTSFDGNEQKTLITLEKGEAYTYTSLARPDVATIENGKAPSRLTVTFGADPMTSKNFAWKTDHRVTAGEIQYAKKELGEFKESNASTVRARTQVYGTTKGLIDLGLWAQLGYIEEASHTVEVAGLEANTEYYYRVGWAERNYWSDVYTFKTAPEEGTPFEILLITDPQSFTPDSYQKIAKVLEASNKAFDTGYDFIVNTGDLVEYSANSTQFGFMFDTLRNYLANTTQVVSAGNHEAKFFTMKEKYEKLTPGANVDSYNYMLKQFNFNMPTQDSKTGAYFSYDYSSVHFVVLNSNDADKNGLGETQLAWLKEDLEATDKKHKVVFMHKSLYSAGSHVEDTEIIAMRNQLPEIFEENGVNIVISGHDHTYTETFYLDKEGNKVGNSLSKGKVSDKGIKYVNLGTVGDKYYKYREYDHMPIEVGKNLHDPYLEYSTFGRLYFDGTDLYYEGFQYDSDKDEIMPVKRGGNVGPIELVVATALTTVVVGGLALVLAKIAKARAAVGK